MGEPEQGLRAAAAGPVPLRGVSGAGLRLGQPSSGMVLRTFSAMLSGSGA